MENRNILVHTHIFKNAGSSFDDALERNFGNSFIDHRDDHLIHKDKNFLNKYINENKNVKAFSSHSIYDKPTSFENIVYHTAYFIRHPIDRIKSVYSFEHKQPAEDSLGAKMAKEFDFNGYVKWRMTPEAPPTIRNMQTIFTAGIGKGHGRMEKRYEFALKNLEDNPLVAVVDRYDESMVVFEDYLCEFFPDIDLSYIRRNVTDKAKTLSPEEKAEKLLNGLDEELAEKVIENNKYDIELYKKANNALDKKIKNIENFQEKLENFQQRCTQLKNLGEVKIKPLYKVMKDTLTKSFKLRNITKKKQKVFIQANCQGAAYTNIFNRVQRLKESYIVLDVKPVHLWTEADKDYLQEKLKECDIFLHQPIFESGFGFYASENLKQFLHEDAIYISFPNLYFTGYHPQAFYLKDEKGRKVSDPFEYHDQNIFNMFKEGKTEEEILKTIGKEDYYSVSDIENNIKESLIELKKREKNTDIVVSNYIENNMIGKKLFHIFNHPNNEMIFFLFNEILQILKEEKLSIVEKQIFKGELLGAVRYPIYKSVQNYFKISEVPLMLKVKREELNLTQMIKKYFNIYKRVDIISKRTVDNSIPKVIIQYWDSKDVPLDIKKLMESWKNNYPKYNYELFNYDKALVFLENAYGKEIKELFLDMKIPAMQSDLFRVAYLLKHGGIYIDTASECINSMDNLFNNLEIDVFLLKKWNNNIANGFIAAKPNNFLIKKIYDKIISNLKSKQNNNIWLVTGPGVFMQTVNLLTNKELRKTKIMEQRAESEKYFVFKHNLQHKKDDEHWSKKQHKTGLYKSEENKNYLNTQSITKKKIIIHIGQHKTASTAIQRALVRDKKHIDKFLYPKTGLKYAAHNDMYSILSSNDNIKVTHFIDEFHTEVKSNKAPIIIISNEFFSSTNELHFDSNRMNRLWDRLVELIEPFGEKEIVFYIREQASSIESRINQAIKSRICLSEIDICNILQNPTLDYLEFYKMLKKKFTDTILTPKIFESIKSNGGDACYDFYTSILNLVMYGEKSNPKISSLEQIRLFMYINNLNTSIDKKMQLKKEFKDYYSKKSNDTILTNCEVEIIRKKYGRSNELFFQNFSNLEPFNYKFSAKKEDNIDLGETDIEETLIKRIKSYE